MQEFVKPYYGPTNTGWSLCGVVLSVCAALIVVFTNAMLVCAALVVLYCLYVPLQYPYVMR